MTSPSSTLRALRIALVISTLGLSLSGCGGGSSQSLGSASAQSSSDGKVLRCGL
ncbi:hypothetical protein AAFF27_16670 [Xylophilus sp. GW821-FHT01B05]